MTATIGSVVIDIVNKIGEREAKHIFDNDPCIVFQFCVGAARHTWEQLFKQQMISPEIYDGLYELIEQIFNRGSMSDCYGIGTKFEIMGWDYQNKKNYDSQSSFVELENLISSLDI